MPLKQGSSLHTSVSGGNPSWVSAPLYPVMCHHGVSSHGPIPKALQERESDKTVQHSVFNPSSPYTVLSHQTGPESGVLQIPANNHTLVPIFM